MKPGEGVRCDWRRWRTDRPVTLPPPPGRRVPRRNSNTGEGGWAPWKLVIGRDSGEASRADPGTREAIAGLEARGAMADPGTREAMADPGTREAIAGLEARGAMAELETQEAMAGLETREAMAYFLRVSRAGQGAPWPWS